MRTRSLCILCVLAAAGCAANPGPGGGDDGGDDDAPLAIRLPQALAGALAANPDVYPAIPVRAIVDGTADVVTIAIDGVAVVAAADGDGFVAALPIGGLTEGSHALEAHAVRGAVAASVTAELVIGRAGHQVTAVGADGNAGTPRLLPGDGRLDLTWTDARDGRRKVRIAELDGAGRFVGEPRVLLERDVDVIYARTALGGDAIGVLFQEPGGPYTNWFAVVDRDGTARVAPIALDPDGAYGSYGGDVAWDGASFVLILPVNDGAGSSHVRWMRVTPTGTVTGPIVVAAAGADDPHGGFDPITEIAIAAVDGQSDVAFVRGYWDADLALSLPRCEVATVGRDGSVGEVQYARPGWFWHHDCRLLDGAAAPVLVWGEQDLTDPADTPPTSLRAARVEDDGALDPARGPGAVVVSAADHRTDPALSAGVMAWLDERSYVDLASGRIELWVAPVDDALVAGDAVVFGHARFIEGTSELGATPLGSNRLLTWIDERHGNGITDPKPEVWIDVAWY